MTAGTASPTAHGPGRASPWPCHHPAGSTGRYDESARRASHSELAVALLLAAEGHEVKTLPEARGVPTPDLVACGVPVEVKAFSTLGQRDGRPASARQVANKVIDARRQGAVAVIWGPGSGLTETVARAGYSLSCRRAAEVGWGQLQAVRVVGDTFDLSFAPSREVRPVANASARRPRLSA